MLYELKGTLEEFLKEHYHEIDFVKLDYLWSPFVAMIETGYYFVDAHGEEHDLYHFFTYDEIDEEYCYYGDVDGALGFAQSYGIWDEETLDLTEGVLSGRKVSDNYQCDYDQPQEARELENLTSVNIEPVGLYYWSNYKSHRFTGEPLRRSARPPE